MHNSTHDYYTPSNYCMLSEKHKTLGIHTCKYLEKKGFLGLHG